MKDTLDSLRAELDTVDRELVRLFLRRMNICRTVAAYKKEQGLPVCDPLREERKLCGLAADTPEELLDYTRSLYKELFRLSQKWQEQLMDGDQP